MGFPINGDLVPSVSGRSHLGVDGTTNLGGFNFNSIRPFGHVHMESGVFHHAFSTGWESGVIRFNAGVPAFQVSLDGGITFNNLVTNASVVTSVGVINGANLVGNVDFTSTSGFIVITDNGGASPLSWNVDVHALSGLWGFPTNGFSHVPQCFSQTFSAATTWTATHNLNTTDCSVMVYDDSSPRVAILPDQIEVTSANVVTVSFNVAQGGRVIIIAC